MENVKTWQWIVIALPAFVAGCVFSFLILKEEMNELLSDEEVKEPLSSEQIANNLLGMLYDHR